MICSTKLCLRFFLLNILGCCCQGLLLLPVEGQKLKLCQAAAAADARQ
jgi:hypothetical protein